jgi:hypothetical protein
MISEDKLQRMSAIHNPVQGGPPDSLIKQTYRDENRSEFFVVVRDLLLL